jgi:hypothetical protein
MSRDLAIKVYLIVDGNFKSLVFIYPDYITQIVEVNGGLLIKEQFPNGNVHELFLPISRQEFNRYMLADGNHKIKIEVRITKTMYKLVKSYYNIYKGE